MNSDKLIVAVGWENKTSALDISDGKKIWTNDETKYICSDPVFVDDKIFFGNRKGKIYGLERESGDVVWHTFLDGQKVYLSKDEKNNRLIATCDNKCYSINTEDGKVVWSFETDGLILTSAETVEEKVFFGSADTHVYAISSNNGELIWKKSTGWSIQTTPDVHEGKLFVGSMDHNLYCFDKNNGERIWSFDTNGAIQSSPVAYGEYVFFGSDDGRFYALNQSDGRLVWSYSPAYTIDNDDVYNYITTAIVGDSLAYNGKVFMSANGNIYGLEAQTFEKISEEKKEEIEFDLILVSFIVTVILLVFISIFYLYWKKRSKKR
ncbi:MAG: PQQ-binding-like beta-propeller repeat protein [Candidatus Thermoplasmatota archaeon]